MMPAYRSSAEGEIRDAVVERLRELRPKARIIHEICASFGGCRMDVLAVSPTDIVAVEIKSKKDKLDRLPAQVGAMRRVSHTCVVALHEKFLVEEKTNQWMAHREREGNFFFDVPPAEVDGASRAWAYPRRQRVLDVGYARFDEIGSWSLGEGQLQTVLPFEALHMLWADELRWLCFELRIHATKRTNMTDMIRDLRWLATGEELTRGICEALRRRQCIEADPAIETNWRAGKCRNVSR